jgi:hypothetical protein
MGSESFYPASTGSPDQLLDKTTLTPFNPQTRRDCSTACWKFVCLFKDYGVGFGLTPYKPLA